MKNQLSSFSNFTLTQTEMLDVTGGLSFAPLSPVPDTVNPFVKQYLNTLTVGYTYWSNQAAKYWTGIPGQPVDPRFTQASRTAGRIRQTYDTLLGRFS